MIPPTAWGVFYLYWERPPIFSSLTHDETINPHHGYADYMFNEVVSYAIKQNKIIDMY